MTTPHLSAIDKALAAAKARKEAKTSVSNEDLPVTVKEPAKATNKIKAVKEPKQKVTRVLSPEKLAKKADRDQARQAAELVRVERRTIRAAKKAARIEALIARGTPHLKKVNNARAKLPKMNGSVQESYNDLVSNFSAVQLEALAAHLGLAAREKKTVAAASAIRLPLGSSVTVTGGDPRYIGKTGTVVHSQKLRAKVQVPGLARLVYIYNGEATVNED